MNILNYSKVALVSKTRWKGVFSDLGELGPIVQKIVTYTLIIIAAIAAIYLVYLIIKRSLDYAAAESPEGRSEAKKKLISVVIGLILIIVGPTLVLVLMSTLGNTVKSSGSSASNDLLISWIKGE